MAAGGVGVKRAAALRGGRRRHSGLTPDALMIDSHVAISAR